MEAYTRIDAKVENIEKAVRGLSLLEKSTVRRVEMRVRTVVTRMAFTAERRINSELSSPYSGAGIKLGSRNRSSAIRMKYKVSKISGSLMGYRITDTGGAPGRVSAIAEFAKNGKSAQGRALVASMNQHFGARDGGRIVYREVDDGFDELIKNIQLGVNDACAEIEGVLQSA